MKVKISAVHLHVTAGSRIFARQCHFARGLNVIRGGNSSGKTQIFQALVFALGMEDMLGSHTPLGSAFTSEISDDAGEAYSVTSSWVATQLENVDGAAITVQRHVSHPLRRQNLVRVWDGGMLLGDALAAYRGDFFVNEGGAATHDLGFHKLLAGFMGWELPDVPRYSSEPTQLYQQVLFPFLYVDQRAGWTSAGPRAVTKYQIREPTRRAAEFLLGMAGPQALAERDALKRRLDLLGQRWTVELTAARTAAGAAGGRLEGLPDVPAGLRGVTREATSVAGATLLVLRGDEWITFTEELDRLASDAVPRPAEPETAVDDTQAARELLNVEDQLGSTLAAASVVEQQLTLAESQRAALDRRIAGLAEERQRLQDVRKLVRLGSHDPTSHLADRACPTCHQELLGVETETPATALDLEGSAAVVAAQLATVQGMREQVEAATQSYRDSFRALQRETDTLRVRMRALRSDLVAPSGYPSRGDVASQVTAEVRLAELNRASGSVQSHISTLETIANDVATLRGALADMRSDTTEEDLRVVAELTAQLHEGLQDTGFGSYDAEKISLDPETLRPRRAGLDIDDDVSASDVVRVKIAYLDGLRRVANLRQAAHPGFLLFDEPRQHEMDEENFRSALSRLANAWAVNDQVIVSSAASTSNLSTYLPEGVQATVIELGEGRVLKPLLDDAAVQAEARLENSE